ncbi:MAG: flavin reductase [Aeromicrobium sp.]|jgi:flavin reductase (DIM6/NTAB) family NADH-FMN oxidoreductase RutF|nr:flavin reductase [Aeromicrobium sp.]MCW2823324.1 flavin reductase [Aeromicrobium sp.]
MTAGVLDRDVVTSAFRQAMGNVAAAVSVVTVLQDGEPHGTTVSAFASLSMEPPMLLVSLDERSALLAKLRIGSLVGVNVLAAHQDQVALRFAGKGDARFDGIGWQVEDGAPALTERHAFVSMSVTTLVEAGDHTLVLGEVQAADTSGNAPLTYWQRTFGTHRTF